jgi:hypothetical protein
MHRPRYTLPLTASRCPYPEGSVFRDFCSLLEGTNALGGRGREMPIPEGSGFPVICSLLDGTGTLEGHGRPMANPEGSGFPVFCSLLDRTKKLGMGWMAAETSEGPRPHWTRSGRRKLRGRGPCRNAADALEGHGRPMANPEGSEFGVFCSLLDGRGNYTVSDLAEAQRTRWR